MSVTLTASAIDFFGVKLDQPIADVRAGMEKMGYKTDTIYNDSIIMTKTVNGISRFFGYGRSGGDSISCIWTVVCPDPQSQDSITLLLAAELTRRYGALNGIDWYDPRPGVEPGRFNSDGGQGPEHLIQLNWCKDNGLITLTQYYGSPYKVEMLFGQPFEMKDNFWKAPVTNNK